MNLEKFNMDALKILKLRSSDNVSNRRWSEAEPAGGPILIQSKP